MFPTMADLTLLACGRSAETGHYRKRFAELDQLPGVRQRFNDEASEQMWPLARPHEEFLNPLETAKMFSALVDRNATVAMLRWSIYSVGFGGSLLVLIYVRYIQMLVLIYASIFSIRVFNYLQWATSDCQ